MSLAMLAFELSFKSQSDIFVWLAIICMVIYILEHLFRFKK